MKVFICVTHRLAAEDFNEIDEVVSDVVVCYSRQQVKEHVQNVFGECYEAPDGNWYPGSEPTDESDDFDELNNSSCISVWERDVTKKKR